MIFKNRLNKILSILLTFLLLLRVSKGLAFLSLSLDFAVRLYGNFRITIRQKLYGIVYGKEKKEIGGLNYASHLKRALI